MSLPPFQECIVNNAFKTFVYFRDPRLTGNYAPFQEMLPPTAGSMARDASCQDAQHVASKEASWSFHSTPGVSPRVSPVLIPAEAMNPFFGNDMEATIELDEDNSEKRRMYSCSWEVDAEDTLPEGEDESSTEAVHLIPDGRGGDESTAQEDTTCRSARMMFLVPKDSEVAQKQHNDLASPP